jgi:hypothetical protein
MFAKPTAKILLLALTSLLSSAATSVAAQEGSNSKPGCTLINGARAGQFISYEKTVEKEVLLRLHNNTDCSIVVETDDKELTGFRRLPNGELLFVPITGSQDGVRLPLHYLVQDWKHWKMPVPAYGWGDSVFHYTILAGQSVIFSVPLSHFRKRFDVLVPFKFEWEGHRASINMTSGRVAHRVYFLIEELPRSVLRNAP